VNLRNQKRMAAQILKCGVHRIWINPDKVEDLEDAITRADIRTAIRSGTVVKLPVGGISSARRAYIWGQQEKGRRRGHGTRKGASRARKPKKSAWMQTIRPLRERLRQLKAEGKIDRTAYRVLYLQAKGGMFKSKAHLEQQLRTLGHLKEATK